MTGLGLTSFGAEGEDFDPSLHEAVQHEGDGVTVRPVIGTVMRQGYRLGDQVLRHALVGVVDTVAGDGATTPGAADGRTPNRASSTPAIRAQNLGPETSRREQLRGEGGDANGPA